MANEPCIIFRFTGVDCPFKHIHAGEEDSPDEDPDDEPDKIPAAPRFPMVGHKQDEKSKVRASITTLYGEFPETAQRRLPQVAAISAKEQGWELPFNQSPLSIVQNVLIILTAIALRRSVGKLSGTRFPVVVGIQMQLARQLSQLARTPGRALLGAQGPGGLSLRNLLNARLMGLAAIDKKLVDEWQSYVAPGTGGSGRWTPWLPSYL